MNWWIFSVMIILINITENNASLTMSVRPRRRKDTNKDMGFWTNYEGSMTIYCYENIQITDAIPPSNITQSNEHVFIDGCLIKNYVIDLKTLNINTSTIKYLTHGFKLNRPLPPGNYTDGLKITELTIKNKKYHSIFENTPNFFDPLTELTTVYAGGVEIPPLPDTVRLVNLTLHDGATIKSWGNCQHLQRIILRKFNKEDFPVWPENCTALRYLEIDRIFLAKTTEMIAQKMIAAASNLDSLIITNARLTNLPIEMISSATNLTLLDLSHNKLHDKLFLSFPVLGHLRKLDLTDNLVQGYGLRELAKKLPALKELILYNESDLDKTCPKIQHFIEPFQNSSVEYIDFGKTVINLECFENIRFSNLRRLFLHPPRDAWFKGIPRTDSGHLTMDFGFRLDGHILFDEYDYKTLSKENASAPNLRRNLTILLNGVHCDCKHSWLVQALEDFPQMISMPDSRCIKDNVFKILDVDKKRVKCNTTEHKGWSYTQSWLNGKVTATCGKWGWLNMEPIFPVHFLNVSGKGISSLHSKLPSTIEWLDLRDNRISRAKAEEATELFAGGRQVWLSNNLLMCDCDNSAFLDAIQEHEEQVKDYNLLKCMGTGEPLSLISTAKLCQTALKFSLAVTGALLVIAGIVALIMHRYGYEIKMYLYSRGWCISCLQKLELDDKPYDAFISFAHEDHDYVVNTLVPGLENAPEKYRVCVHYRDWLVGDWIPAQIMRSVQQSKRTLILLSRNFIVSPWSTIEFRYAIANAAEEPNAKVLVLILDDVLGLELDAELQSYLTYNTYLRCDDEWFWEKLRYAMPHRVKSKVTNVENIDMTVRPEDNWSPNIAIAFPNTGNDRETSVPI